METKLCGQVFMSFLGHVTCQNYPWQGLRQHCLRRLITLYNMCMHLHDCTLVDYAQSLRSTELGKTMTRIQLCWRWWRVHIPALVTVLHNLSIHEYNILNPISSFSCLQATAMITPTVTAGQEPSRPSSGKSDSSKSPASSSDEGDSEYISYSDGSSEGMYMYSTNFAMSWYNALFLATKFPFISTAFLTINNETRFQISSEMKSL